MEKFEIDNIFIHDGDREIGAGEIYSDVTLYNLVFRGLAWQNFSDEHIKEINDNGWAVCIYSNSDHLTGVLKVVGASIRYYSRNPRLCP